MTILTVQSNIGGCIDVYAGYPTPTDTFIGYVAENTTYNIEYYSGTNGKLIANPKKDYAFDYWQDNNLQQYTQNPFEFAEVGIPSLGNKIIANYKLSPGSPGSPNSVCGKQITNYSLTIAIIIGASVGLYMIGKSLKK